MLVDREVIAISPKAQSRVALLPLRPTKNTPCTLRIQTHVATRSLGAQLHVFESDVLLPRFSVFRYLPDPGDLVVPKTGVTFSLREPVDRIVSWICSVFIVEKPVRIAATSEGLKVHFVSVCQVGEPPKVKTSAPLVGGTQQALVICVVPGRESGQTSAQVRFQCESMDLAADLTQDLAKFCGLAELDSVADFPSELVQFEEV